MRKTGDALAWAALLVVYVAWGATYVAIRVAVEHLPPVLAAGIRFLVAGLLLWPLASRVPPPGGRGTDRMGWRQWAGCAVVGILLLAVGNGGVSVAEQTVPAGTAALLVATVPLWMAVFGRVLFGVRIPPVAGVGLLVGIAGVGVIVRPGSGGPVGGLLLTLGASAAWGLGSVLSRHLPLPARPLLTSTGEMLTGGLALLLFAGAIGEDSTGGWSGSAVWAMVYLVLGGSILGFTCYAYALARLPTSAVSTYAYVNPVVAVVLGWVLLDEHLSWGTALGAALVVVSVALTVTARPARPARRSAPEPVDPDAEAAAGLSRP
jgi:drug/metabolite transporter (DMT)-like permease